MRRTFITALAICMLISGCSPAVQGNVPTAPIPPAAEAVSTPAPTPEVVPAPEPTPDWQSSEGWFLGDWAGVATVGYGSEEAAPSFDGFMHNGGCLMRLYGTGDGYEAAIGSSIWKVTEHGTEGLTLTCTQGTFMMEHVIRESIYAEEYIFTEGQTMRLAYLDELPEDNSGAQLPQERILFGQTAEDSFGATVSLTLAHLPSGDERPWGSGSYPCWFGGYEDMEGGFEGMFCLGTDAGGRRLFGQVFHRKDGVDMIYEVMDGDVTFFRFGERALPYDDLVHLSRTEGASVWFPQLMNCSSTMPVWENATVERKGYFKDVFIPAMEAEISELQKQPEDIWTRREISVRQGYIDYAGKLIRGDFNGLFSKRIPFIPDMVMLDAAYRQEASLAGISPGDTIEDAKKLYPLHPLSEREAPLFGIEARWISNRYTDGRGLLVNLTSDGRISSVELHDSGYDTPDGRQTDDPFDLDRRVYHAKDALIEYGSWSTGEGEDIGSITMTVALDRVWDETELDIDGDGSKERVTLSGKALGYGVEQPTLIGGAEGFMEEGIDFGTMTRLSVYSDEELIFERELPLYTYYQFTPRFSDRLRTDTPGEIYIQCETGGTGNEIPVYRVTIDEEECGVEYLGCVDVYS